MSYIIQIRNASALKDLDHEAGIDDLFEVCKVGNREWLEFYRKYY